MLLLRFLGVSNDVTMVALNTLAGILTVSAVAVVTVVARRTKRRVELARHQQRTLIGWAQQMNEWRGTVDAELRGIKRRVGVVERKQR